MNPIFQAVIGAVASLARTCPNCRHRQVVARADAKRAVRCARCGAEIPAPVGGRP